MIPPPAAPQTKNTDVMVLASIMVLARFMVLARVIVLACDG